MKTDIIKAYRDTRYTAKIGVTLIVDSKSEKLDQLLSDCHGDSAIYITAWNPYSELKTSNENARLNGLLKIELLTLTNADNVIDGFGEDPSGKWPGEESFLAIRLSREQGIKLSEKYRQNAFVYHQLGDETELILTLPSQKTSS